MVSALPRIVLRSIVACALVSPAAAQTALPLGTPQQGKVGSDAPTDYTVVAKTAGVLSVAVQGEGDLALVLTDEDGQTMPDGTADRDMNGSEGTEMLSVVIAEPGNYRLRVHVQGGSSSTYQISAAWLPFAAFARASTDPDRRPTQARAIQIGKAHEDTLSFETGDNWDWFVLKPTQAGTLAIVTRRVGEGDTDLVMEVFLDGKFGDATDRSDQDLQGNNASEAVNVNVTAGQTVHVKISTALNRANTKYRISSSLIP